MDSPRNADPDHDQQYSAVHTNGHIPKRTSSLSSISLREKGDIDGAYRKPIALVENIVQPSILPAEYGADQAEVNPSGKYCFLCCGCCPHNAHGCGSHWRTWLRYAFYLTYVLCILGAIPAMVVVYKHEGNNVRTRLWLIGGLFVFLSIPISLQLILLHLINYTEPKLQRHIVRILWMPVIYAVDSV